MTGRVEPYQMTNDQLNEIARQARTAAQAARSGWPVTNPYPYNSDEHKLWQERFVLALKGRE